MWIDTWMWINSQSQFFSSSDYRYHLCRCEQWPLWYQVNRMEDFKGFLGYNMDHLGYLYPKWIINLPEEISAFDLQGVQFPVPLNFRVTKCDMWSQVWFVVDVPHFKWEVARATFKIVHQTVYFMKIFWARTLTHLQIFIHIYTPSFRTVAVLLYVFSCGFKHFRYLHFHCSSEIFFFTDAFCRAYTGLICM